MVAGVDKGSTGDSFLILNRDVWSIVRDHI